jgi:hypothetical protein
MSKASEWSAVRPVFVSPSVYARVGYETEAILSNLEGTLIIKDHADAAALGRWLLDTFGETPNGPA